MMVNDFSLPSETAAILVALGAGLLIGIERERSSDPGAPVVAGVRTFAIASLLGVLAALSGSVIVLGAAAVGVVALTVVSYLKSRDLDPGLTTEMALLAAFVIGVLAVEQPMLAAAGGVIVVILLVARGPLQGFARKELSEQELRDAVLLAGAAILVLPLLPDHPIDPWGVVNPRLVWQLTVLIMMIDAVGYVAQRVIGPKAGLPLSGLLGGFVSSTAVVATMGRRAQSEPAVAPGAAAGAALSQIASIAQLALVLAVSDAVLLGHMRWPLLAAGVAAAGYGVAMVLRSREHAAPAAVSGRAFRLRTAMLFAAAFTLVALVVAWLQNNFGPSWALAGVVIGGLADAHSTSASVGSLAAQQQMPRELATVAVGLVLTTNTVSKLAFARAGGAAYFWKLAPGLVLMVAAFWAVWWLSTSG